MSFLINIDVLWNESNFNWLIILGVKPKYSLNSDYFWSIFSLFEVYLPDSQSVESLVNKFLMMCLILLIVFEWFYNFLHFDPLIKGIYHLKLLLGYALKDLLLLDELIIKLSHFWVASLKYWLQLVSFFLGHTLIFPDCEDPFCLSKFFFDSFQILEHILRFLVAKVSHCMTKMVLMMS